MVAFLGFMAGKDGITNLLKKQTDNLTDSRLKTWHSGGAWVYAIYCVSVAWLCNWWLLVPGLLLRVSLFDLGVNKWSSYDFQHIGTTAFWDKQFSKIFGSKGAVKKAIVFFILVIALNLVYFKVHGQPFIGAGATTSGMNLTGGYSGRVMIYAFDYRLPLIKSSKPNTIALLVGYKVTPMLTASVGAGRYRVLNFSKYNEYFNYQIEQVTKYYPAVKIDTYRTFYNGDVFVSLNWCRQAWAAVGIRAYIY